MPLHAPKTAGPAKDETGGPDPDNAPPIEVRTNGSALNPADGDVCEADSGKTPHVQVRVPEPGTKSPAKGVIGGADPENVPRIVEHVSESEPESPAKDESDETDTLDFFSARRMVAKFSEPEPRQRH